jgi:glycosyltransferase involved in cell wall biosynthesis
MPLYRRISQDPRVELTVYFCSNLGRTSDYDASIFGGYRYRFLKNISPAPSLSHFFGLINPEIAGVILKGRYDAVWVHGWSNLTDWLCFAVSWFAGTAIMLRGESNLSLKESRLWKRVKRPILSFLFKRVKAFLAIGTLNADFYRAYGVAEEKIFFVPYVVDNSALSRQCERYFPQRETLRRELGMPQEKMITLFVGRLTARKRPMDLLEAFATLENGKAALVFIGDGEMRTALEGRVRMKGIKNVCFAGFRTHADVIKFFAVSDIFILPGGQEPWGMVVNEAMNFRLPVIIADEIGSGRDLVKHGDNGFIYRTGDVKQLSFHLSELVKNPKRREEMGSRSKELIAKWDLENASRNAVKAMESIAHSKKSAKETRQC